MGADHTTRDHQRQVMTRETSDHTRLWLHTGQSSNAALHADRQPLVSYVNVLHNKTASKKLKPSSGKDEKAKRREGKYEKQPTL